MPELTSLMLVAYGGTALAAAAAVMLFLVAFFGDLFIRTDEALRRWMDAIMWCIVGGLLVTAAVSAWTVVQLHH